ncbi:hypothetical protein NPS53_08845 [Pseudomonas putida]|uniref:hypothetical protein n=1 Tax=Pseudomonas putida TaxID=303 RepID=UPI00236326C3|nr:hypothetical protein [Pseudomonas putida]MDD2139681.1 hypothetical protein [Pseudomonas putida]HDS1721605.1 hypothetical protein [Pseudomonas putida]
MANFKDVNKAIKKAFPALDIQAVRGNGYVFFDGDNGFDVVESVYSHPTGTSTETMIRLCLRNINDAITDGKLTA